LGRRKESADTGLIWTTRRETLSLKGWCR